MAHSPNRNATSRGFTLVELMMVVTIIGVVAALAIVGYGRWVASSKMAEATHMVGGIKSAQENYFAQVGQYYDLSQGIMPPFLYPQATPGPKKVAWAGPCVGCKTGADWQRLGVKADAPVYFGYATVAGPETCDPTCRGVSGGGATAGKSTVNWVTENGGVAITKPWFIASAMADTNGNSVFARVLGSSLNSRLIVDDEGE